jgi:hypothetical protein
MVLDERSGRSTDIWKDRLTGRSNKMSAVYCRRDCAAHAIDWHNTVNSCMQGIFTLPHMSHKNAVIVWIPAYTRVQYRVNLLHAWHNRACNGRSSFVLGHPVFLNSVPRARPSRQDLETAEMIGAARGSHRSHCIRSLFGTYFESCLS